MKVQITSMIEISEVEQIDEICRAEQKTRSEFIRDAIQKTLTGGKYK